MPGITVCLYTCERKEFCTWKKPSKWWFNIGVFIRYYGQETFTVQFRKCNAPSNKSLDRRFHRPWSYLSTVYYSHSWWEGKYNHFMWSPCFKALYNVKCWLTGQAPIDDTGETGVFSVITDCYFVFNIVTHSYKIILHFFFKHVLI